MTTKHNLDLQVATEAQYGVAEDDFYRWSEKAILGTSPQAVTLRLVDDPEMTELNEQFRQKSGSTNVLSFPFEAPIDLDEPLLGDVIICMPVVAREAEQQNKTLDAHLAHMVVHGLLHLQGFDHIETDEAELMEAKETAILAELGYANPYQSHPAQ